MAGPFMKNKRVKRMRVDYAEGVTGWAQGMFRYGAA
jgi:hypothetical protein